MDFDKIDEDFLRKRAALKWGRWEKDVIPLSVADLDFRTPREIKEGIIRAVREDRTPYATYGGDPDVLEVVYEKIQIHFNPGRKFFHRREPFSEIETHSCRASRPAFLTRCPNATPSPPDRSPSGLVPCEGHRPRA